MTWNRYWWPSNIEGCSIEVLARFNPHKKTWEISLPSSPDPEDIFIEMPIEEWEKRAPRAMIGGEE